MALKHFWRGWPTHSHECLIIIIIIMTRRQLRSVATTLHSDRDPVPSSTPAWYSDECCTNVCRKVIPGFGSCSRAPNCVRQRYTSSSSTNIRKQAWQPLFPSKISIIDTNYNKSFTNTIITLWLPVLCQLCSLKFRAAKYYNELPEDIKFELDDSEKYNKSVLRNYLFNTEHWAYHIYTKSNYLTVNLFEIKTWLVHGSSSANV